MIDSHLVNTIRMLERHAERKRGVAAAFYICCPEPNGDGAQMCFEQERDSAWDATWKDYAPDILWAMREDASRRGLEWEDIVSPAISSFELAAITARKEAM